MSCEISPLLFTCLPACLPTYLPICLPTYLPTYLSIYLPIYLSIYREPDSSPRDNSPPVSCPRTICPGQFAPRTICPDDKYAQLYRHSVQTQFLSHFTDPLSVSLYRPIRFLTHLQTHSPSHFTDTLSVSLYGYTFCLTFQARFLSHSTGTLSVLHYMHIIIILT